MNLLLDPWIPVRDGQTLRRVSLRDVLCTDSAFTVATARDDFDAAVVTLAAALTQVLFRDLSDDELVERERTPLGRDKFSRQATAFREHFDLYHPRHPFMQTRGVAGKIKLAGMLVPGAPGETSHLLGFREASRSRRLCDTCATLALYARATMSPSFGGGYCNSLRGGAPIDFHVRGSHLRESIWRNVISGPTRRALIADSAHVNDIPTWVSPLQNGVSTKVATIGLVRGLLWQPAVIELFPDETAGTCDLCGIENAFTVSRYRALKFKVSVDGLFPHPRGSRRPYRDPTTGKMGICFASYSDSAPVWSSIAKWATAADDEGRILQEPPVVTQYRRIWPDRPIEIAAVGCVAKQSKVVLRRSETIVLAQGRLELEPAHAASSIRDAVFGAVLKLGQEVGLSKGARGTLASRAALEVSHLIDGDVCRALSAGRATDEHLVGRLRGAAMRCFENVVEMIGRDVRTSKAVSLGRVQLRAALATRLGTHQMSKEVQS